MPQFRQLRQQPGAELRAFALHHSFVKTFETLAMFRNVQPQLQPHLTHAIHIAFVP
jgi:hypothetical protein